MEIGKTSKYLNEEDLDAATPPFEGDGPFWCQANGETFNVRMEGYAKKKKKAASGTELYEVVSCDLIKSSKTKLTHIAQHLKLPEPSKVDDLELIKESGLPRLFVMNIQIPNKRAAIMGGKKYYDDDAGVSLIAIFTIKPETVKAALDPSSASKQVQAQINLLKRYNQNALSEPDIRRRFKGIAICDNWDHFKMKSLRPFKGYNGKPAIINKIGDVFQDADKTEYLEVDIKVHTTQYLARKGLDLFRDRSHEAKLRIGFTIQGESEDELPENIFACFKVCNVTLDPEKILEIAVE